MIRPPSLLNGIVEGRWVKLPLATSLFAPRSICAPKLNTPRLPMFRSATNPPRRLSVSCVHAGDVGLDRVTVRPRDVGEDLVDRRAGVVLDVVSDLVDLDLRRNLVDERGRGEIVGGHEGTNQPGGFVTDLGVQLLVGCVHA